MIPNASSRSVASAAAKNAAWMAQVSAEKQEEVDQAWNFVTSIFEQRRRIRGDSVASAKIWGGITFFDLGLGGRICNDATTTAKSRRELSASHGDEAVVGAQGWRGLYLDMIKRSLTNYIYYDHAKDYETQYKALLQNHKDKRAQEMSDRVCEAGRCEAHWDINFSEVSFHGDKVPATAHTVMRLSCLTHIQMAIEDVIANNVHGDLIEAGAFRGGGAVLMRATMGNQMPTGGWRTVWVADSFEGIPMPRTAAGEVKDDTASWGGEGREEERYASSMENVKATFRRYGLLDERVGFIPGFFNISLPKAPLKSLAVAHIDADSYESVLDALSGLYPKLSPGGYLIVDDYHLAGVRLAVREYRAAHDISEPLEAVPSDHITTCSTDPINSMGDDWLYRNKKHLVTRVGAIGGAFWQKKRLSAA